MGITQLPKQREHSITQQIAMDDRQFAGDLAKEIDEWFSDEDVTKIFKQALSNDPTGERRRDIRETDD